MTDPTWGMDEPQVPARPMTALGWGRVVVKLPILFVVNFVPLLVLLALRVVERPLFGPARPITPWITQGVCRLSLRLLGVRLRIEGAPLTGGEAMVANHSSWLDIYALNAATRLYFVSKAEVASWPGIGWLARATGTLFIARDRRQAAAQIEILRGRLAAGHKLLFFPEGTTTDGQRVLPFKPTLFAAFLDPVLKETLKVQPVSVQYHVPKGEDPRFYNWWGDMGFGPHLIAILSAGLRGEIRVRYGAALSASAFNNRKVLAKEAEEAVRLGKAPGG